MRMVTAGVMPSFTGASGPEFRATLKAPRGEVAEYLVKARFRDLGQSVPVRDCYADFPDVTGYGPERLVPPSAPPRPVRARGGFVFGSSLRRGEEGSYNSLIDEMIPPGGGSSREENAWANGSRRSSRSWIAG
jgi:hypothetical protein